MAKFIDYLTYPFPKLKYSIGALAVYLIGGGIMAYKGMPWFLIGVGAGYIFLYLCLLFYRVIK